MPWTLRIHDIGDFYSADYTRAWYRAVAARPQCLFWFYTRSFTDKEVFAAMTELARLPNCQGWLSADGENFRQAIEAKESDFGGVWKLALLQQEAAEMPQELLPALAAVSAPAQVVNFPYHRGRYHVVAVEVAGGISCQAVSGALPLMTGAHEMRPCQSCRYCLPA